MEVFLIWATFISTFLICFAVWKLLALSAERADLQEKIKNRFKIISAVCLFGWYVTVFLLAGVEVFAALKVTAFPSITILLGISLPIIIGLILLKASSTLKKVIQSVPPHYMIGIQIYRVLGAIFLGFYLLNRLPGEFALPAGIGDVIVGGAAPIVGYFLVKNFKGAKPAASVWNLFGIFDLIVAVSTGFLTSPSPFQLLAMENPNRVVTVLPLVLIPTFAVPLSILLHIISLKQLRDTVQAGSVDDKEVLIPVPAER